MMRKVTSRIIKARNMQSQYFSWRNIVNRILRNLLLAYSAAGFLGCSSINKVQARETDSDLFVNTEKHLGEHVVVHGFLRYKFENRNLFPTAQQVNRQLCLPVLIKNVCENMIKNATERDGSMVEITGTLVSVARPGMVSVSSCKQVGLEVESIR